MSECARVSQLVPVNALVCSFDIQRNICLHFIFCPCCQQSNSRLCKFKICFFTELCCLESVSIIDSNVWVNSTHGKTVFKT